MRGVSSAFGDGPGGASADFSLTDCDVCGLAVVVDEGEGIGFSEVVFRVSWFTTTKKPHRMNKIDMCSNNI